jgi:hypothetical protein
MSETSADPWSYASRNFLVPELAMIPKHWTRSVLLIPIPVSSMIRVLLVLSGMTRMRMFGSVSNSSGAVMERYLILSSASEQLEINSLKKISLFD